MTWSFPEPIAGAGAAMHTPTDDLDSQSLCTLLAATQDDGCVCVASEAHAARWLDRLRESTSLGWPQLRRRTFRRRGRVGRPGPTFPRRRCRLSY